MADSLSRTELKALTTFTGNDDYAALIDNMTLLDDVCQQPFDKRAASWAGVVGTPQTWVEYRAIVDGVGRKVKFVGVMASGAGDVDIVHVQKSGSNAVVVKTDTVTCVTGINFFIIDSSGVTFDTTTYIGIKGTANIVQYNTTTNDVFYFTGTGNAFTNHGGYTISYWIGYDPKSYVLHLSQKLPLAGFDLAAALLQFDDVQLPSGDITLTSTVVIPTGKTIRGVRGKTRILLSAGIVGLEINSAAAVTLRDFTIVGNNAAVDIASTALLNSDANIEGMNGLGTEKGIYIHGQYANEVLVDGVVVQNIDGIGIDVYDTTSGTVSAAQGIHISTVTVKDCYCGLRFQSTGEYNNIVNLRSFKNQIGLAIYGGNNYFSLTNLAYNRVGLLIGPATNGGHGTTTNMTINHCSFYGIYSYDLINGFLVNSCQAWLTNSRIKNATGLQWSDSTIASSGIALVDCPYVSIVNTLENEFVTVTPSGTTVLRQDGRRTLSTGRIKEPFVRIS